MALGMGRISLFGGSHGCRQRGSRRGRRRALTGSLSILLGVGVVGFGSEVLPSAAQGQMSQRSYATGDWTPLWSRVGNLSDTTFFGPVRIMAHGEQLLVLDQQAPGVVALGLHDGRVAWRYARRGRGPGELMVPRALTIDASDRVVIGDATNRRLTTLDSRGRHLHDIVPQVGLYPYDLCGLNDGGFLVIGPQPGRITVRLSGSGQILPHTSVSAHLPQGADITLGLGVAARAADLCVIALQRIGRIVGVSSEGIRFDVRTVEPMELADSLLGARGRSPRLSPTGAALAIAADGGTVSIAFDGRSDHFGRVIDEYDASTGRYVRSLIAPGPFVGRIVGLARRGDVYVFLHGRDGDPAVSAFRWNGR